MDSGRTRRIPLDDVRRDTLEVRWVLSEFQWAIFQSWFEHKIDNGADWFTIDLILEGTLAAYTARFVDGAYRWQCTDGVWTVEASLEVEEVP